MSAADVRKTADMAQYFVEIIRPFPGNCKCTNAAGRIRRAIVRMLQPMGRPQAEKERPHQAKWDKRLVSFCLLLPKYIQLQPRLNSKRHRNLPGAFPTPPATSNGAQDFLLALACQAEYPDGTCLQQQGIQQGLYIGMFIHRPGVGV